MCLYNYKISDKETAGSWIKNLLKYGKEYENQFPLWGRKVSKQSLLYRSYTLIS